MSAIETLVEVALAKATKDSAVHGVDKDQYLLCSSVVKADVRNYHTVKVLQKGLDESQAKAAALALLSQQYPQLAAGGGTASDGPADAAEKVVKTLERLSSSQLGHLAAGWATQLGEAFTNASILSTVEAGSLAGRTGSGKVPLESGEEAQMSYTVIQGPSEGMYVLEESGAQGEPRRSVILNTTLVTLMLQPTQAHVVSNATLVKINGSSSALAVFRKLPKSGSAAEDHVSLEEILQLADGLPAAGAVSLSGEERVKTFARALEAKIGDKATYSVFELRSQLERLGPDFTPVAALPAPKSCAEFFTRNIRGENWGDFAKRVAPLIEPDEQRCNFIRSSEAVLRDAIERWLESGLGSLREASVASLALRTDWSVDAACSLMYQFAMAKDQQRLAPPTPPPGVPPPILTQPIIKITTGGSGEGGDEALSAAAAAQSLTTAERECVKRLAALAAIEDNKGVDEIAKYIDGASSAGAPSPHIMRLVHATDASVNSLASSYVADDGFVVDLRSIRRAMLRRLESMHFGFATDKQWSEEQRRQAGRIRVGRFSEVDIACLLEGQEDGFSKKAPLAHIKCPVKLQMALGVFFSIWAKAHLTFSSHILAFGANVARFLHQTREDGASWEQLSDYWRKLMQKCEQPALRFERKEALAPLQPPLLKWADDRSVTHVAELMDAVNRSERERLAKLLEEARAPKESAELAELRKMVKQQGSKQEQHEERLELNARLGRKDGKDPCWFHHIKGSCRYDAAECRGHHG
ncbi:hypothetical protein EMIHUDRAFT_222318 [Emiliania huxleyi CCMP1516]|uniref:C3H1-type domain-containing protein n=2 Tax=Emiliania huxleyi TaxID=2903 RepID=A0A0D3KYS6_EMIH1|nr:hypothetical protein EMIHUDRAFT_222318 [Emiliania huxleyi CCMP1516]EOD40911.1 hypothetical protein EMIHUDRAFT_222318 [Emiliania huxleyi CCMP1516]|eukprot:XP_005793340.1 hypothetical protein EMIHUDRAFT_222318 [Emiliania huxleyi CCMP1516]